MRILLIGPKFFHYVQSIEMALKSLKHEVIMYSIPGYTDYEQSYYRTRIYKLGFEKFGKEYYMQQNNNFLEDCIKMKPDICLILNGDLLDSTTMKKMKQLNIKIILWMMDSIQKKAFKKHLHKLLLFDKIFSFEPSDIPYLKNMFEISAIYLPIGYDSFVFNKSNSNTKTIDIVFIGALSKLRKKILNDVAKYSLENNKKISIIMPLWTNNNIFHKIRNIWHKFIFSKKYPFLEKVIQDKRVGAHEATELYRRAKVCLNIHTEIHTGLNPRGFEIMGCGSFHLVDKNAQDIFIDKEHVVIYENDMDLISKIDYYLKAEDERELIAYNGYIYVENKFRMAKSLEIILTSDELSSKV